MVDQLKIGTEWDLTIPIRAKLDTNLVSVDSESSFASYRILPTGTTVTVVTIDKEGITFYAQDSDENCNTVYHYYFVAGEDSSFDLFLEEI